MRAGQLRPLVPAHQTSSALINGHHPGTHQEPLQFVSTGMLIPTRCIYESHWPDRSHPCPSAALLHCSRAASSLELRLVASGGLGVSSPISTFLSASPLNLGDLSG